MTRATGKNKLYCAETEKRVVDAINDYHIVLKLNHKRLAAAVYCHPNKIGSILRGNRQITFTEQLLFLTALGVDIKSFYIFLLSSKDPVPYEWVSIKAITQPLLLSARCNQIPLDQEAFRLNGCFGEFIRQKRQAPNPKITMRDLGRQLQVPHSFVGKTESNKRRVMLSDVICLAEAFNCSAIELIEAFIKQLQP